MSDYPKVFVKKWQQKNTTSGCRIPGLFLVDKQELCVVGSAALPGLFPPAPLPDIIKFLKNMINRLKSLKKKQKKMKDIKLYGILA